MGEFNNWNFPAAVPAEHEAACGCKLQQSLGAGPAPAARRPAHGRLHVPPTLPLCILGVHLFLSARPCSAPLSASGFSDLKGITGVLRYLQITDSSFWKVLPS